MTNTYTKRAAILLKSVRKQNIIEEAQLTIIDCETSAAELISSLLKKNPFAVEKSSCSKCGKTNIVHMPSISIEISDVAACLQKSLKALFGLKIRQCDEACGGEETTEMEVIG